MIQWMIRMHPLLGPRWLVVLGYCCSSLLIVCGNCASHMHSYQFVVFLELSVQ